MTITGTGAFHSDAAMKAMYLTRVRHAEQAGNIMQRFYWRDGQGCAVGVMQHGDDHQALATALNVPRALIDLLVPLHDGLSPDAATRFPARFLDAIPVGADLSRVVPRLVHWLLVDPDDGVLRLADADGATAIVQVADLYARQIAGDEPTGEEWRRAAYAANAVVPADGVASAAYAAACADAAASAYYAAGAWDASGIALAAGGSSDRDREQQSGRIVARLLTLLAECAPEAPVPQMAVRELAVAP